MTRWPKVFLSATLVTMLAVPLAGSGHKGKDLPIRAIFVGAATWQFPGTTPSNCTVATTVTSAVGHVPYLGHVAVSSTHCPAEAGYVIDGKMTITTADGAKLFGEYDYDPASTSHDIPITITGGTGRFWGATGTVVMTFTVTQQFKRGCADPIPFNCMDFTVPWPWTSVATGTVRVLW